MKYDFETIIDRLNSNQRALSWELGKHTFGNVATGIEDGYSKIPMWVADMSFAVAPFIQDALKKRIDQATFGYFYLDDSYYDAIIDWQKRRHNVSDLSKAMIGFDNGVVGGIAAALAMDGKENDPILIHNPCYIGFKKAATIAKRQLIYSNLIQDKDGIWRMDYADMEEKIRSFGIKKIIMCNPHNPSGRVWEKDELQTLVDLAIKYDCTIIDDEIWSDIISSDHHITSLLSFESIRHQLIYLSAPSKTFSLAGLTGSYDIVCNPQLREKFENYKEVCGFNKPNALSVEVLKAGYTYGDAYVDQLNEVIHDNLVEMARFINSIDGLETQVPDGTYMLYVDCTQYCQFHGCSLDELLAKGVSKGVLWQDGRSFGHPCSIRINCALPNSLLKEAIKRLSNVL